MNYPKVVLSERSWRCDPAGSTARLRRDASDARDRVAERLRRSYGYYALSAGISVTAIRDTYINRKAPAPYHQELPVYAEAQLEFYGAPEGSS